MNVDGCDDDDGAKADADATDNAKRPDTDSFILVIVRIWNAVLATHGRY